MAKDKVLYGKGFQYADELAEYLREAGELYGKPILVFDSTGTTLTSFTFLEETLSDGSKVFNIMLR